MIEKIAIIGAGAIGSFFINGLSANNSFKEKTSAQVWTIATGKRKARLQSEGIIVNGKRATLNIKEPKEAKGADLIIVCVKYNALADVIPYIKEMSDEHTIIMCPMNGVDTEEIIYSKLNPKHLLHSMMVIAAQRSENDIFYNDGVKPCVHFGKAIDHYEGPAADNFDPANDTDVKEVIKLFEATGLNYKFHEDIIATIWNKFALNISTNIAQAIIGCRYGAYKTSPYMNALGQMLCDEVIAIAKAKGINCTFDNQRALKTIGTNDSAIFSTLQDLLSKRHTEIDMFSGAVVRMGKEAGIPTPYNEFAYLAIKALEEKNDGLI